MVALFRARQAARSGRSGEGLGDGEPLVGVAALGGDREVGAVGALSDQEAEVEERAGDPLGGSSGPYAIISPSGVRSSTRNSSSGAVIPRTA